MLAIDLGIVYDNTRHINETYKRKPKNNSKKRFKKEGKLYGAMSTRPSIFVSSCDFTDLSKYQRVSFAECTYVSNDFLNAWVNFNENGREKLCGRGCIPTRPARFVLHHCFTLQLLYTLPIFLVSHNHSLTGTDIAT